MDTWRTVQFFLDADTGDVDEVEWREADGALRCTCSPAEDDLCAHREVISSRIDLLGGNCLILMREEAAEEIEGQDLDVTDPATLRDLVRRYGVVEVL